MSDVTPEQVAAAEAENYEWLERKGLQEEADRVRAEVEAEALELLVPVMGETEGRKAAAELGQAVPMAFFLGDAIRTTMAQRAELLKALQTMRRGAQKNPQAVKRFDAILKRIERIMRSP
jgi:hypothetical protein